MIEQRSAGPNRSLFGAVIRVPSAFRLECSISRVIPAYTFVPGAGRNDARKQRELASSSQDEHCVAIAEEAVTAANRFTISFTNQLDSD